MRTKVRQVYREALQEAKGFADQDTRNQVKEMFINEFRVFKPKSPEEKLDIGKIDYNLALIRKQINMMKELRERDENNKKDGSGSREGFKQAFRRRLFQIYFELMKERNIDLIFAAVLMAINFIQIYGLLYNEKIGFPFQDDLYSTICSFCDLIRIYPLIEAGGGIGDGYPLYYWLISFGLIVILVIYLLLLVYVDYSIKIEKFYFMLPIKLLRIASSLIFWVFSMPIIETFVAIFSCISINDGTNNTYHVIDNSLQCWSGMHIFYCILFSISLFGYFLIFLLISFFYNESRPYHTDAFSRLDTNFETHIILYKVLITIIGHFLFQQSLHWLIIVIHILGSINFCKIYLQYLPYYNSRTSMLFGAGWFIYAWLTINILLTKALQGINYQGQSIVIIIGAVLLFPAVQQIRENKIQKKIFTKKHDKIKSEFELDLFIYKIHRLIIDQHVNEVDEMILLGIVHNHQSECLNSECPLNSNEELYLPLTDSTSDRKAAFSKDPILLYHLINSIYAEYAKSSNSTTVLHTTYAYFLFYQISNIHNALLELNIAEKCDTTFQQKFTVYRAKRFIENHLINKFGKGGTAKKEAVMSGGRTSSELDVTIVITFEGLYAKLNKEIEKSANDHIEFWSHLDSQMVDLNVLHKLGLNIINNTKRINELWNQLTRINPNYPKALQIYGNYLVQIKNDNSEGEEFLMKANIMSRPKSLAEEGQGGVNGHQKHINDFEMMFAEDTAIVVISGNKDSTAKITKTNNGITKLFGYNTFEVHGHEVNILMPPIIGVKHNYFLDSFFKTGKETNINNEFTTFAMLRAGHIFSISLIVKPVPSLKNDIQYIGLIKPTGKDYDYILTDQFGKIDSISKGITSMLQLQPTFFKENEIFVQVICPQLCETDRNKSTKEVGLKFDLWTGVRDLTFIIPRNFSNLSQKSGGRGAAQSGLSGGGAVGAMKTGNQDDEENGRRKNAGGEANFVGLKSPDHLKKVCNMFRNQEFKNQPQKYLQTLRSVINYDNPEIFKGPVKTEIINKNHCKGVLHLKIFKILNPKKNGGQTSDDSDSIRGVTQNTGNKNVRALIDETNKRIEELNSEEIQKRLVQMKQALEQVKKGIRHPSAKLKPSNIVTPGNFEIAEINRYSSEIKQIEQKYKEIKLREELEENRLKEDGALADEKIKLLQPQNKGDFLLMDQPNLDYEQVKQMYPLRENKSNNDDQSSAPDQKQRISVNDISAFGDDSILRGPNETQMTGARMPNNPNLFEEVDDYDRDGGVGGNGKARFKEEDEHLDLLKDIRAQRDLQKVKPLPPKKKKEGGEQEPATPGNAETPGETPEGQGEAAAVNAEEKAEDEKFLEEDTGSVASSTKSLAKHLRMLRNALYENYLPPSINNLKINAKIVFSALLIITIVWYVYSKSIYQQLKDNIENIHSSEYRMNSLTDIGANTRALFALNQGIINPNRGGVNYESYKRTQLLTAAQLIQKAQNNLSTTYLRDVFTQNDDNQINPDWLQLIYNTPAALPMFYYVDIWSAIMTTSVHALSVKQLPLSQISRNDTAVFFILTNSLNNILASIESSTDAILNESGNISNLVNNTLLILLIVASCSLFISLCLIFPVATKVDKNKDELLRHFMLIDREDVKKQLEKCRIFFNTMHDKEHMTQQNDAEEYENEFEKQEEGITPGQEEGKEGEDEDGKGAKKQRQRSRKNKMHKKYSTNFISLIVKFLFVVTILEGYFILCYFQSGNFLLVAQNLIQESGTITMRHFSNNFLYQIMQEVLTTNGLAQVMNQNSLSYIFSYLNSTIQQQEDFLKEHSNNSPYHSSQFNSFFNNLIYQNVCDAVYAQSSPEYATCQTFMGGILMKGLYSANVAYWDNMRSMATDFNNSARDRASINKIMNSQQLIDNENLKDIYFDDSYTKLLNELDLSIFYNFDQRDSQDTILFAVYIVVLFLLYFILWNKFMETTRHSLWVTKSMLAIIPLDIIQKVPKIKDFLLASSKTTLSALND